MRHRSWTRRRELRAVSQPGSEITLAERLDRGPLALDFALQCATDLAAALRQLHADGSAHGFVQAETVLLRDSSARFLKVPAISLASRREDVAAFGVVLYQLVHGYLPPAGFTDARPAPGPRGNSGEALASAATELAYRCMASADESAPTIQKALMEVRLLSVMARQGAAGAASEPAVQPAPQAAPLESQPPEEAAPQAVYDLDLEPVTDLPPSGEHCPRCGGQYVYESKARTWVECALERFRIPLFRCHRCYHRYGRIGNLRFSKDSSLV